MLPPIMIRPGRRSGSTSTANRRSGFGFSTLDVASAVRGAIYGNEAGKYRVGKDEYKIMVRLNPAARENLNGLDEIMVFKDEKEAPLSSVAVVSQGANIASIKHVDGKRTIQVTAELAPGQKDERGPKSLAMAAVNKMNLPWDIPSVREAETACRPNPRRFSSRRFLLPSRLVFLIMVFQFNSLFQPFLILIGILLSVGGVFWGLAHHQQIQRLCQYADRRRRGAQQCYLRHPHERRRHHRARRRGGEKQHRAHRFHEPAAEKRPVRSRMRSSRAEPRDCARYS